MSRPQIIIKKSFSNKITFFYFYFYLAHGYTADGIIYVLKFHEGLSHSRHHCNVPRTSEEDKIIVM